MKKELSRKILGFMLLEAQEYDQFSYMVMTEKVTYHNGEETQHVLEETILYVHSPNYDIYQGEMTPSEENLFRIAILALGTLKHAVKTKGFRRGISEILDEKAMRQECLKKIQEAREKQ